VSSAATIIRHVEDGLQLARKYRLPPRIRNFIAEHHGTKITNYQYHQAVEQAGEQGGFVNPDLFRYPGPRPQSRETALIMLADSCEARARAQLPKNEEELSELINSVFELCQHEGQLDDTRLTLKDLSTAKGSFASSLRGIYHPRILYPETKPKPALENPAQLPVEIPAKIISDVPPKELPKPVEQT
jgi:membrane-associated HD superfamily phosphohydrolase